MIKHTNERLEALETALKIAISDDHITSDQVLETIRDSLSSLSVDLRARAAKASNIADGIKVRDKSSDNYDFISFGDTIVRPDEDDAYDPMAYYGAAQSVPMFSSMAGADTISFDLNTGSSSSDTISF